MSLITDLPAIFDQFSEARQKGFHRDGSQRAGYPAGGNLIAPSCRRRSRWRRGGGGLRCAQRRMKPSKKPKRSTAQPLPAGSATVSAKPTNAPIFTFSDLVVGETTCDGKKKMYEYMAEFKAVHVMQLPNSSQDAAVTRAVERNSI